MPFRLLPLARFIFVFLVFVATGLAAVSPTIVWSSTNNITYGTTLSSSSLNATANSGGVPVAGTFIYTPAAGTILPFGTHTLSVSFTPTDTVTYNSVPVTTRTITVAQRTVSLANVQAVSRMYDGSYSVSFSGTPTLTNVISADVGNVALNGTLSGALFTRSAGTAKPVSAGGLSLTGSAAGNYVLSYPSSVTTVTVTQRPVTVTGLSIDTKIFDGGTTATANVSQLSAGNVVSGDNVSIIASGVSARFSDGNAGSNKPVSVSGLSVGGIDGPSYSITSPFTTTGTIIPAPVQVVISNNVHPYDGGPKTATISTTPAAALTVTYSNTTDGDFPRNAGVYNITVTVSDNNHSGSGVGTLTITKARQDLKLSFGGVDSGVGSTLTLNGSVNTGLPITYSIVSGNATLSGNSLRLTEVGPVTVRATQAGNENYEPATTEQIFVARSTQTIRFTAPRNYKVSESGFNVSATATSGLSVSFSIVSGPATVSGNRVNFSGASGRVVIRASQAGDGTYAPAPDVTWLFAISNNIPDTFFGALFHIAEGLPDTLENWTTSGEIAAATYDFGTRRGTVLFAAPVMGLTTSLDFEVTSDDGSFAVPFTVAGRALMLAGKITDTILHGRIDAMRVFFDASLQARTGPTASLAGRYQCSVPSSASGGATSIVAPNGRVLMLATIAGLTIAAEGTIATTGFFKVNAPNASVNGLINAGNGSVNGIVTLPGGILVVLTGLASTATRTDRLANLSSRVRIAPTPDRTLVTGFVIGGTESRRVLLRAIGPALTGFGVSGALVNPRLQVFNSEGKVILENDDWSGADTAAAFTQTGAFSLAAGTKDAALLATLPPGAYTMQITAGAETGVALAEIYDAGETSGTEASRVINISARGLVEPGPDGLLVGGFVITGNSPKKVLIRGVGPVLGGFGVPGTLADPRLAVYASSTLIAQNDDWGTPTPLDALQTAATAAEIAAAATKVGAFAFGGGGKDAAILITLDPGPYTAQVSGTTAGVALVEIYEVP